VQLIAIPALTIFYNLSLGPIASPLIAIALLAAIGLTTVGTLLSAMAIPCSSRRARSYISVHGRRLTSVLLQRRRRSAWSAPHSVQS
jgi:high-affinity K+ transport system ATPase subunit B